MSPQSRIQSSHLSSPFVFSREAFAEYQEVEVPGGGAHRDPGGALHPQPPHPGPPWPIPAAAAQSTNPIAVRSTHFSVCSPFAMQTAFQFTDHLRGEETPEGKGSKK